MEKRKLKPSMNKSTVAFIKTKKILLDKGEFKKRYKPIGDKNENF